MSGSQMKVSDDGREGKDEAQQLPEMPKAVV